MCRARHGLVVAAVWVALLGACGGEVGPDEAEGLAASSEALVTTKRTCDDGKGNAVWNGKFDLAAKLCTDKFSGVLVFVRCPALYGSAPTETNCSSFCADCGRVAGKLKYAISTSERGRGNFNCTCYN